MPAPGGPLLLANRNYVARRGPHDSAISACEAVLATGLKDFLAELVTVDGTIMVSFICKQQHANLDDIIVSSMEHTVRAGRLFYGNHAEVDFDWGKAPRVALGMELRDEQLTAFFEVVLSGDHVGIAINGIQFVDRVGDATDNVRRFAAAVAGARPSAGLTTPS
jgi:hypothetical protein